RPTKSFLDGSLGRWRLSFLTGKVDVVALEQPAQTFLPCHGEGGGPVDASSPRIPLGLPAFFCPLKRPARILGLSGAPKGPRPPRGHVPLGSANDRPKEAVA